MSFDQTPPNIVKDLFAKLRETVPGSIDGLSEPTGRHSMRAAMIRAKTTGYYTRVSNGQLMHVDVR